MNFAKSERAQLCDLFEQVGPLAHTLCGEWTTHDLVAHLWIRETDPLGAPGILAKPLAGLTERRMTEAKNRWDYAELVDRVRRGPARMSIFAFPGVDEEANTVEYFIHHEDVRRAGEVPRPPRTLEVEVEDWMWRRLKLLGRALFRRSPVGVALERVRPEEAASGEPETIRAMAGSETVTVIGQPSELLMYAYGRLDQADVREVGEEVAVAQLRQADHSV